MRQKEHDRGPLERGAPERGHHRQSGHDPRHGGKQDAEAPENVEHGRGMHEDRRDDLPQGYWPAGGSSRLHVDGVFFANSRTLLRDAATRGLGIAVLPMMEVRRLLDGGELVQVLPGSIAGELVVVIAHPEREFIPPQVRAFADALTRWAVAELAEVSPATPPRNGRPQASRPRKGKQGAPRRALDR